MIGFRHAASETIRLERPEAENVGGEEKAVFQTNYTHLLGGSTSLAFQLVYSNVCEGTPLDEAWLQYAAKNGYQTWIHDETCRTWATDGRN